MAGNPVRLPPARSAYRQNPAPVSRSGDGDRRDARTVGISFCLPGALLEALSANRDRAPDWLQRGVRHEGASFCQGLLAPE